MTQREDMVRVSLYGCMHKPKMSAMVVPKTGETYRCGLCKKDRVIKGVITTWARAQISCNGCTYKTVNDGTIGKKRFIANALRHANSRGHTVHVIHDGEITVIKPQSFYQVPLIDDLLLP